MVLTQFLTPLNQYCTIVRPCAHKVQGLTSWYVVGDGGEQLVAHTSNLKYSLVIKNTKDYYSFLAICAFNLEPKRDISTQIAINHPYRQEMINSFHNCKLKKALKS